MRFMHDAFQFIKHVGVLRLFVIGRLGLQIRTLAIVSVRRPVFPLACPTAIVYRFTSLAFIMFPWLLLETNVASIHQE